MTSRPVQRLGKYAVSSNEFPDVRYPSYIDGHILVMSRDVLDELHEAAHHVKLDDIYMSFLAMQAGLKLTNIPGITRESISFIDFWGLRWFGLRHFDSIISSHYITSDDELITIYNFQSKRGNV
ncbi:hypothetical protein B566_EDAN014924 [Ephemera danica]|nr:hypothetical protein B566_EDAN014924 [Ephemera danica]